MEEKLGENHIKFTLPRFSKVSEILSDITTKTKGPVKLLDV